MANTCLKKEEYNVEKHVCKLDCESFFLNQNIFLENFLTFNY
jgi:hypothetical protein